ncbi:MaoC/PaaZ C-terminal domain-containing protein [Mangrovitalea sediminis]|uniref:MaoC/PaaZ C-terminal domain-containing protein n=1 Tax=Mangrovitalea sediminis TaxID=1982043 RepID=UPI000BE520C3|nr:MaoC/PaaZ C-terminal domain-containing protein [Mangrovitalea sediminis]
MTATARYIHHPPALWSLYGRAIIPKGTTSGKAPEAIPALTAELLGVRTNGERLHRYRKLCGFANHSWVPVTWPHLLAFPLHMRLLTDEGFPLPLLGLVHLRNRIVQQRPIKEGECLDILCRLANSNKTDKGLEFDIVTEALSAGQVVWTEHSTTLFRQPSNSAASAKSADRKPELARYSHKLHLEAPSDTGRRYGKLSGDLNPIHLYALTARAFGFRRAIAHGMWSKASCIALLERQTQWPGGAIDVQTAFKKPLFLPGNALLNWREDKHAWPFQLLNAKGDTPHLTGHVEFLD